MDLPQNYTVTLGWVPPPLRTEWHPTEQTGPFSVLTRGSFYSSAQAHAWVRLHVPSWAGVRVVPVSP